MTTIDIHWDLMTDVTMMIDEVLIVVVIEEIETGPIARAEGMTIVSMIEIDKVDAMVEMMIMEIDLMADMVVVDRMKMIETLELVGGQVDLTQMILQN